MKTSNIDAVIRRIMVKQLFNACGLSTREEAEGIDIGLHLCRQVVNILIETEVIL